MKPMIIKPLFILAVLAAAAIPPVATAQDDPALQVILESPVVQAFNLPDAVDDPATVDELVALGLRRNRGLRAAASGVQAALERVPQAKALPDPRLGVVEYLEPVETRVGPQERAYQLSQSFPWFGTLGAKGDIQRAVAAAARAELEEKILAVMTRLRTSALELAFLDSSIAVTQSHLVLLSQWEAAAQGRYAAGRGSYASLIKTQVELGKLSNRLAELEDRRVPVLAAINADLDRAPDAPLALRPVGPPLPQEPDEGVLSGLVATGNPRLAAWDHRREAARLKGVLAGKQGLPSFTLGVNLIQTGSARMPGVDDSGKNALMATLGVQLPLWRGKYGAMSREAVSDQASADDARRQEMNALAADLSRALFRFRDAVRQNGLYADTLVPKARQSMDAARAAFEAGEGSFLDLIDAQRLLLEFQLAAVRARTDLLIQQAVLEQLIAAPLASVGETQS